MILNSQKNIYKINLEGEDLTGIRERSASGENIMEVAREKGFSAVVTDLCDNCANDNGNNQVDEYELQGTSYDIKVVGLIGKDEFAKGFFVTFSKSDL